MPVSLKRFSARSPALPALLARCWKARSLFPTKSIRNAKFVQSSAYSSIAHAMLGRAVQNYEPPPPRREKPTATAPSASQTTKLEHMLKMPGLGSQKSLGGFTNYLNSTSKQPNGVSQPSVSNKTVSTDHGPRGVKRTSAEMGGLVATLNNVDAFEDHSTMIDLTQTKNLSTVSRSLPSAHFDFDPNDFEDDSDLDLDIEYPQALPQLSINRDALRSVTTNSVQTNTFALLPKNASPKIHIPQSSGLTWSSSPPSHKVTPPGPSLNRYANNTTILPAELPSSEASIDAYPRPAKRRSVPWLQKQAEERRLQEEADRSEQARSRSETLCDDDDLQSRSQDDFTPLPKNKMFPWDTTPSAIKEQQKAFKNQQKKVSKDGPFSLADMQDLVATTRPAKHTPIRLSDEQKNVLDLVIKKKRSVFFTGSAGTGKSVLMRSIIDDLRKMYAREPDRVAVTASTGLAACNIGGVTLHSFGGIGLGKEAAPELVKKISRNAKAKNRWLRTKVLIVDEISMVDGDLFDKLESIARLIKKDGRPFGGIQLVITGDFFQLPPVPDNSTGRAVKFAFDAGTWSTAIDHTIGLTEVFRQKDPVFANMLNEMRLGKITDETVKAFRRLERPIKYEDALDATELFPTRYEVENANAFKMRDLMGKEYSFRAEDSGTITDVPQRDKLLSNCMAPPLLTLKKGAQVMLIKNLDDNLVNGSLGRVHAFMTEKTFEIYDRESDLFESDPNKEVGENDTMRQVRNKLKSMINKDLVADTGKVYPVIRFTLPDGTSRDLLCQPEDWKVELPNGEVQAQRRQLPLILAWALSIHKAQGQTLQRVTVDLRKVFEKGQAYVALSRATCQEGLQVKGFDKKKVMAHPRVAEFYNSLYSVNAALKNSKSAKEGIAKTAQAQEEDFMEGRVNRGAEYGFDDDEEEAVAAYG